MNGFGFERRVRLQDPEGHPKHYSPPLLAVIAQNPKD